MSVLSGTRILLIGTLLLVGCSAKAKLPGQVKTFPVKGVVQVDGAPAKAVTVVFHAQADSAALHVVRTITDADGKFVVNSYGKADGLPDGDYALTFNWPDTTTAQDRPVGPPGSGANRQRPDKLNSGYSDPKQSQFKLTIQGAAVDLGVIALSANASNQNN